MKDNILELIKNKNSRDAIDILENDIKEELINKLDKEKNIKVEKNDLEFIHFIDFCIKKLPDDYDVLTYIRNLHFFSEKSDLEKINELTNIYINFKKS